MPTLREQIEQRIRAQQGGRSQPGANDANAALRQQITERMSKLSQSSGTEPELSGLQNAARGFNGRLADAIGVPIAMVDEALGIVGMDAFEKGSQGQAAVRNLFNKLGIETEAIPGISKKIGEATFDSAVTTGALIAAAPAMAARTGAGLMATLQRGLGQAFSKPGKVLLAEAGAIPGSVVGEEVGGPIGGFVGALAGGVTAQSAGRKIAAPVDALRRFATRPAATAVDPRGSPISTKMFAEEQIAGDLARVDNSIRSAIESVPRRGIPEELSESYRTALERSLKVARRLETRLWNRIPKTASVAMDSLENFVKILRREGERGTMANYPKEFADRLALWAARTRPEVDPKTGRMVRQGRPVKTEKLLAIRSDMLDAIRAERAGLAPRRDYLRNLGRLVDAVTESVKASLPDDVTVEQARAFSKRLNDMFTRGPIGEVLRYRAPGDPNVDPAQTVDKLLSRFRGPEAAMNVEAPRVLREQMQRDFQDTIRARFREAVDEGGVPQGEVFIQKNAGKLKGLSNVAADLSQTSDRLVALTAERQRITKSALAKYAQEDPAVAIQRVFSNQNPREEAQTLVDSFRGDPDALDGFKTSMIEEFLRRTQLSGERMKAALSRTSPLRGAFEATLSASDMQRLERIAEMAVLLEQGQGFKVGRALTSGAVIAARIVGAQGTSIIARLFGHGATIQSTGIVSNLGREFMERVVGKFDIKGLISKAIVDPRWEKLLFTKLPFRTEDMRSFDKTLRRLIAGIEANNRVVDRQLRNGDNNE